MGVTVHSDPCFALAHSMAGVVTMKKRPRDPAQLAKFIVDVATGEVEDREPDSGKEPGGRRLGSQGR